MSIPGDGRDRYLMHVAEVRARRQLMLVVLIGAIGAVVLIGVTLQAVSEGAHPALFALPGVYLVPLLFGVALRGRMRMQRPEWMGSPIRVNGLDRPTRHRVMSAVRHGRVPAETYEAELAREFALSTVRTRWLYWVFLVMAVVFSLDSLLVETAIPRILLLTGAILSAVAGGAGFVLVSGARRTLAAS